MSVTRTLVLAGSEETDRIARALAPELRAGDVLLLAGPVGAGKSQFARATIRARLGEAEEVPSPTFTLVQVYGEAPEIWHADLYRLSGPGEIAELGLEEAFGRAICLVEWPDRLGPLAPEGALRIDLAPVAEGEARRMRLEGGPRWAAALAALEAPDG